MITRDQAKIVLIEGIFRETILSHNPCDCAFSRVMWRIIAEMATGEIDDRAIRVLAASDQADAATKQSP